jgi:hypothetical protein
VKIRPQIFPAAHIFSRPLLNSAAEYSASWQHCRCTDAKRSINFQYILAVECRCHISKLLTYTCDTFLVWRVEFEPICLLWCSPQSWKVLIQNLSPSDPTDHLSGLEKMVCYLSLFRVPIWQGRIIWMHELCQLKGTQDLEFFWLRFWFLCYFFVSFAQILRFCKKTFSVHATIGGDTIIPRSLRLSRIEFSLVWD